jgi:hypothetical protein
VTTQKARDIFDQAAKAAKDPDVVARIELCREYFTNPVFRKTFTDLLWEKTNETT